ncbi:unnamed protein product, partial [Prorocentrum cordatum]
MAAVPRCPDIPEFQVAVRYDADPNFTWHHRILLRRVRGAVWIALTPDLDLERINLDERRHRVLERGQAFPEAIAGDIYAFDPIGREAVAGHKRRARLQAAVLGGDEDEAMDAKEWVYADLDDPSFGTLVAADVLEGDEFVELGNRGLVRRKGAARGVEKVGRARLAEWSEQRRVGAEDIRSLGIHTAADGTRHLGWTDAVGMLRESDMPEWRFEGPRVCKELAASIREGAGNPTSYHAEWIRLSGVNQNSAIAYEHKNAMEMLRVATSVDQVDISNLASFELLARRVVMLEMAVARDPRDPDFSGLGVIADGAAGTDGAARAPRFRTWVSDQQKERANILKQPLCRAKWRPTARGSPKPTGGLAGSGGTEVPFLFLCPTFGNILVGPLTMCSRGGGAPRRGKGLLEMQYLVSTNWRPLKQTIRTFDALRWRVRLLQQSSDRAGRAGLVPDGLSPSRALQELFKTKDLHGQEPRRLASYDPAKLRVAKGVVEPKDARALLPPHAAQRLRRYKTCIELSAEEIEAKFASEPSPKPYWDPVLRRNKRARHELFGRLLSSGILVPRRRLKGRIGLFFVKKKEGAIRLIVDARNPNACHKPPPTTQLGTAQSFAELNLAEFADVAAEMASHCVLPGAGGVPALDFHQSGADVRDGFYQFSIVEVADWFGIDESFSKGSFGITKVHGGHAHGMAVASRAAAVAAEGWGSLLRERAPAPRLVPGQPVHAVYVDNHTGLGHSAADAEQAHQDFRAQCAAFGLDLHDEAPCSPYLEALGLQFDGPGRRLRHRSARLWRFKLATVALLRRRVVAGWQLEIWLGHAVHMCGLGRPLLSILSQSYAYVAAHKERSGRLWRGVRRELWLMSNLVFTCEVELDAPFNSSVYLGDSSDYGYALMETRGAGDELLEDFKWRERWRFKAAPPLPPPPRPTLGALGAAFGACFDGDDPEQLEAFGEPHVVGRTAWEPLGARARLAQRATETARTAEAGAGPGRRRRRRTARGAAPREEVEGFEAIPVVGACWDNKRRWHTLVEGFWHWRQEHINVKEARVCLMGLRRSLRTRRGCHRRLLTLSDNLVSAVVFDRGRSSSWALNALCRRAAAYQIAGCVAWRVRHIRADRNHADEGSRRPRAPRVLVPTRLEGGAPVAPQRTGGRRLGAPRHHGAPRATQAAPELFAGTGRLSASLKRQGLRVLPGAEIKRSARYDLSRRSTQRAVLRWIRSGKVWHVHLGTACSAWSVARSTPYNTERARRLEAVSVDMALFTAEVIKECDRCGVLWSLENPASSKLFRFEPLAVLASLPDARYVSFDLCGFGENVRKPTTIFTNAICLDVLGRRCDGSHRHEPLQGGLKAGAYSPALCREWAAALCSAAPPQAFGDSEPLASEWDTELEALVPRAHGVAAKLGEAHGGADAESRGHHFLARHVVEFGGARGHQGGPEEKERLAAARRARVPPAARDNFLRLGAIRDSTKRLYSDALGRFKGWAKSKHCDLVASLQLHGRNVLYGYIHFETHLDRNKANLFPKASRALRGWTTRAPRRVRDPIPFGVVCLIGLYFLGKGLVGAAVCLVLQFDCYLRPDEAASLLLSSVLPPAPRAGRRHARAWALLLGEAEHAAPAKTGVVDGTVVIGELQRSWVAEAVGLWYRAGGAAPYMFDMTLSKYEALFRQAAFDLGLTDLDISPRGVRHAGASHDMYMGLATLDQIQKR